MNDLGVVGEGTEGEKVGWREAVEVEQRTTAVSAYAMTGRKHWEWYLRCMGASPMGAAQVEHTELCHTGPERLQLNTTDSAALR